MSFMLKISSGGVCAAAVVVLCFAFWPHVKPDKISAKPQVAQPEFVVASASTKPITAPAVAAALGAKPAWCPRRTPLWTKWR